MEILSPGKLNLFLAVTGKRPDGYHTLITLFCRIGLFDRILLDMNQEGISVSCDHPEVPCDKTNTAHRAAEIFFSRFKEGKGHPAPGVAIRIEKTLPVGAGLGGGSSNAASVLMGLNQHFKTPFSKQDLLDMAVSVGADVPFFIFQKPALGQGIGEELTPWPGLSPFRVVLVYPSQVVSTREVFKNLNLALTNCEQKLNGLLFKNETFRADRHLCNDLEPVTTRVCPEIPRIKDLLKHHGAEGAMMTGSGPTVFGLFSDDITARIARDSLSENKNWQVFLSDLLV